MWFHSGWGFAYAHAHLNHHKMLLGLNFFLNASDSKRLASFFKLLVDQETSYLQIIEAMSLKGKLFYNLCYYIENVEDTLNLSYFLRV